MDQSAPATFELSLVVPLMGRDEEAAILRGAANAVLDERQPRVVTVIGPNGVGKSRLIGHLLDMLTDPGARPFRIYRGNAKDRNWAYEPLASLLRSRFEIVETTASDAARARIRTQVSSVLEDRKVGDFCFFLGQLLDLPFTDSPLIKAVHDDPKQGELLRRAVIRNFFDCDSTHGPICLVLEDLDVAGDAALDLAGYLVEHLTGPTLVLCSARPELLARRGDWFTLGGARHTRIELGPVADAISERAMHALLAPCLGGPPPQLVEAGVRLAGGNLGLLEAMVRIFHDCGVLEDASHPGGDRAWRIDLDRLSSVTLPHTVEDAVAMRLSALTPDERSLLEHAATVGVAFWHGAVMALRRAERRTPNLWHEDESEIDGTERLLRHLVQRDYILRAPSSIIAGEREFSFKHALEREKLVELTNQDAKRRYHQIVADWLRAQESVRSTREYASLLAYHLESAGSPASGGVLYLDAGDGARDSYALKEAAEFYEHGLRLLGEGDAHRRIDGLHNYGDVLVMLGRTDEALLAFREMLAISYRLGLKAKGGAAHNRIGRLHRTMGALLEAVEHLETALRLFEAAADERGVAACHDDVGKVLWTKGDYESALERMRTALEMRQQLGDRRSIALSLHNIGVVWRDYGQPTQAQEALEASLRIRREIGDLLGVAQTLNSLGRLAQDQAELDKAQDLYRQAYDVAVEIGERNRIAVVLTNLGEIHYRLGNSSEAIRILKQAEELCDELGDRLHLAEAKRGLAKAYLMQNELKKARVCIKHAVDLFGQVRSKSHLATALRTLGEITAAGAWGIEHEAKAVDYFMRSIALCKEIGNEFEIAKSYRSFSNYVSSSEDYSENDDIQREARKLRGMAEEIFARLRISPERLEA